MSFLSEEKKKLLALRLRKKGIETRDAIPHRDPSGPPRLSFAQRRLWVLDQLEPGDPFYNIPAVAELRGPLDPAVLARAFAEISRRHESLRTTFTARDGRPYQVIAPAADRWKLPLVDLRALPAHGRQGQQSSERVSGNSCASPDPSPPAPLPPALTPVRERGAPTQELPDNVFSPLSRGKGVRMGEGPGVRDQGDAGSRVFQRPSEAERLAWAEMRTPCDLARGPLVRTTLLRLGDEEHVLLVTLHHIISDGWSNGLFLRELAVLYEAFAAGRPSPLPELPIQYADFAEWQQDWLSGERLEKELGWWRERLAGATAALDLPTDRPRPAVQTYRGARLPLWIAPTATEGLRRLARSGEATLYMVLLAAFDVLLRSWTGQDDLVVGSPVANRRRPEIEGLIGFFANTLVLRADLAGDPTFRELLVRVREAAHGAFAHQDLPFEKLVEELQLERDLSRTPLFQVLVVLQNAPRAEARLTSLEIRMPDFDPGVAKFDLMLDLTELDGGLRGALEFNTDLFDRTTIQRLAERFHRLLDAVIGDPGLRLSEIPQLSEPEAHLLLHEWAGAWPWDRGRLARSEPSRQSRPDLEKSGRDARGPRVLAPEPLLVHDLVAAQAARTPEAPAVLGLDDETITYRELARRANRLAWHLRGLGIGPESRVAIALDRSVDLVVSILAVLEAGAAYVPLDPNYPEERRTLMLQDSGAAVVLTHGVLDELDLSGERKEIPAPRADSEDLAYIFYTSGSTGRPKGVAMRHGALANLIAWQTASLPGVSKTLQFTSPSFDVSFQEIFSTWASGGTLVLISEEDRRDPATLWARLRTAGVERLFLPFVALQQLAEAARGGLPIAETLREIVTAGEQLRITPALAELFARLPGTRFHNHYGPAETHVVTSYELAGDPASWPPLPPIGRPIAGGRVHVVDRDGRPAPVGVPGELLLGGAGLARGYIDRPELTAERFAPDPFEGEPGARLYRTGDLARWLPDGNLEFLGRVDTQVKIRGYRVEPGEIEALLGAHPEVREAAVVVREERPGDRRLVAWIVPADGAEPDSRELRRFVAERLPDYMVPSAFVLREALPLTPSGKVDRRTLARLVPEGGVLSAGHVPPRTPAEELLAGIWAEVLGVARVGATDHFFELGGHSLLGTQVVSRIRAVFGVGLPLRVLFEAPTLEELAKRTSPPVPLSRWKGGRWERGTGGEVPLLPSPGGSGVRMGEGPGVRAPLSFAQQRLWFLDRLDPAAVVYNLPVALRVAGRLDLAALAGAFDEVIRRHEALRTRFDTIEGEPVQIILDAKELPAFPLPVFDLSGLADVRGTEAERLARAEAGQPFDLRRGPLVRALLLRLAPEEHILVSTMHHIASDGWSMGVLVREIAALYTAFREGRPSPLPELLVQYADHAVWQRQWLQGETLDEQLAWWRQELDGAPTLLELPADHPRPPVESHRGAAEPARLPAELNDGIGALARREGATPFLVLLAGFQALLHRTGGQDDLLVGTPVANRTRVEVEGLIGFFVNTLALRGRPGRAESFRGLLAQTRASALGAFDHQHLPFERLVEALGVERHLSHAPLVQVLLVVQNAPTTALALPGLTLTPLPLATDTARLDLTLSLGEADGGGLEGFLEYATDLFDAATMRRFLGHFQALLTGAVADPGRRLADLPLLTPGEQAEIAAWSGTVEAFAEDGVLLHELVLAQAARTPDAVAVAFAGEALTCRELDTASATLADRLRARGVGADVRVGLCAERSLEMVVGLLAILRAGGAYVPLDPAYPAERLAFLLEDSGVSLLLAQERCLERLPAGAASAALLLDPRKGEAVQERAHPSPLAADPAGLAYVIYTSGSTGRPKGAMVSHRAVVNHMLWMRRAFPLRPDDAVLQKTSFSFDASVWELFLPLVTGARLVLAPPGVQQDPALLVRTAEAERITVLQFVPPLLRIFLDEPARETPAPCASSSAAARRSPRTCATACSRAWMPICATSTDPPSAPSRPSSTSAIAATGGARCRSAGRCPMSPPACWTAGVDRSRWASPGSSIWAACRWAAATWGVLP